MKTYIIFEAGVNHNGNFDTARQMMYEAKRRGADAIKFQKWGKEYYDKCEWRNVLYGLDLSYDELYNLRNYAISLDIEFICTAFDENSWVFIKHLDPDAYKIPSNQYVIENKELVNDIVETSWHKNKRLFISTSRYRYTDIQYLYSRNPDACFFHCVSKYPTPVNEANLNRMIEMKKFCKYVGLSDHSATIEISVAAVALGAQAIEVHVTLDKNMEGPDHKASLDIQQFETMVRMIRNVEKAL